MAQQFINTGSNANDGTGDPLRTAFIKIEDNFIDLYDQLGSSFPFTSSIDSPAQIVGGDGTEGTILGITGSLEVTQDITASAILLGSEIIAKDNSGTKIVMGSTETSIFVNSERYLEINGNVSVGPSSRVITVNPDQLSIDFRAEGDSSTNLLYVDASTDQVGIKTDTPSKDLDVNGSIKASSYFGDITDVDPEINTQFYQTSSEAITAGASGFSIICVSEG